MTEPTTTEPAAEAAKAAPHAAVIELVHRHGDSQKFPYAGAGSIIIPNRLRIDGVAIWASYDRPAVIHDLTLDGTCRTPFAVTVTLQARALRVGEAPTVTDGPLGFPAKESGAVIEIPGVDELFPGEDLDIPHVLVNGSAVYIQGPVKVGRMATDGPEQGLAEVTLTLLCRRLLVDDEPTGGNATA